ncbi:hypothetical protein RUR49_11760 [Pseudoxanthobacter sp. M-2]|uniref:hypothetical protein n=1 Tax=Pseudoxanthobacter sp. M-2 TaxID=3078754 RepID=UPI0038FC1DE5
MTKRPNEPPVAATAPAADARHGGTAPSDVELDEFLRKAMPAAVAALVAVASNEKAAPSPRTTAAIALLRAVGVLSPITVRVGSEVERLTPAEMGAVLSTAAALSERRGRIGARRPAAGDLFE